MTTQVLSNLIGTRTSLTMTLTSLANVTYVASSALDLHNIISSATAPLEVVLTVEITPGTVSGNKQARLFLQTSMDGTNYSSGPTSGTTTTDEPNLIPLGQIPLATNSTLQRRDFPVLASLGFVPYSIKLICLNDSGAAFAGSGCAAYYTVITGDAR